jgi:hypothetical protein
MMEVARGGSMSDGLAHEAATLAVARDRMTGVEAAARVMYHLGRGEVMTPAFVSAMTGLSRSHASDLLSEMSRVVPIYSDEGHWSISPP